MVFFEKKDCQIIVKIREAGVSCLAKVKKDLNFSSVICVVLYEIVGDLRFLRK